MIMFDFENGDMAEVVAELGATPKQAKLAGIRAAKRTAGTIRRIASKGLKTELGLRNATALRRRIKEYRVDSRWTGYKVFIGLNDLPVSAFKGRAKKVAGGVMYGEVMLHGAFFVKLNGGTKIMVRHGKKRWSIGQATIPVGQRAMTFLEDNVYADVNSIFMKHFLDDLRARTILKIGAS